MHVVTLAYLAINSHKQAFRWLLKEEFLRDSHIKKNLAVRSTFNNNFSFARPLINHQTQPLNQVVTRLATKIILSTAPGN